jgi:hypothetical protein
MRYRLSPIFCRPWLLNGITPRLIESHYENNYGGSAWKAIKGAVKVHDAPKGREAA